MITNFEEVSLHGYKTVKCAGGCGRRLQRTKKFYQTLNPFNKDKRGRIKGREQIYKELNEENKKWKTEAVFCIHCGDK